MLKDSWRSSPMSTSADEAIEYARRAVNAEARGHGDIEDAMYRLAAKTGVSFWTWWGLWNRRRKTADDGLLRVVRSAYLLVCQRELTKYRNALAAEEKQSGNATDLENMAREAAALAEELRAKAERAKVTIPTPFPSEGEGRS